jgi:hypothetical protein
MKDTSRRIAEALLEHYDVETPAPDRDDATVEGIAAVVEEAMGNPWIPVSERLPEPTTLGPRVLVRVSGYYYPDIAKRFASGEWISGEGRVYRPWDITHWMPLPEPPPG